MENVKNYNYNVKSADSKLEPIELFFINKFNHNGAPKIDFLEMGINIVHVLYFKDEKSCEYYKCFVFKDDFQDENGNTKYYFKFKVEKREECSISENIKLELSKLPNRCIFLFPYSRVELAESIKKYTDPAAPEDEETLLPELGNLAVAEKCSPDKICAKLILDNKDVKFAYSTLPENKKKWLSAKSGLYSIDDALFNGGVNIEKIKSENDAYESENSESKHYTMRDLYKMQELKIEKGKQIEFNFNIKYVNGTPTTLQKILTSAGIEGDFYLRFLPDGFARVYILLGYKKDELKAVAYMYTYRQKDAEETVIKVVKISETKTDSGKVTLSGVAPTKGPVDNTNNEKPAGAGTKKGENTKSTNDNTQTKEPNVDLTTAFRCGRCDTVNIMCAMVKLYSACAWFMIVVREFIECLYNKDYEAMKSDYKDLIKFEEFKKLKDKSERNDDEKKRLKDMETGSYGEQLNNLYKWPEQSHVYDYGNCHVLLTALSKKLKRNANGKPNANGEPNYNDVVELINRLKDNIYNAKKIRDTISHYDLDKFNKSEINVDEKINTIISFIEEIKEYERFEHLSKYLPPVQKLLVQPVSIKYCPKCGEELPGGEYTFRPEPKG